MGGLRPVAACAAIAVSIGASGCAVHDAFQLPAVPSASVGAAGSCARDRDGAEVCLRARTDCSLDAFDCDPALVDPVGQLRRLAPDGQPSSFGAGQMLSVAWPNHFQSVQRLSGAGPARFLVTRSTATPRETDFGLVEPWDRTGDGDLAADELRIATSRPGNGLTRAFDTGTRYTHAGGGQRVGRLFAVPLERDAAGSEVLLYDVSRPSSPRLFSIVPHVGPAGEAVDQAGTASLAALADGHYLLVIGRRHANRLDFYRSATTDVATTAWRYIDGWSERELRTAIGDRDFGDYQNLALVPGADGALYMLGSHRDWTGHDWLDLHRLGIEPDPRGGVSMVVTKVARKHLRCYLGGTEHCDLDAGAGSYVGADGRLRVYAISRRPAPRRGGSSAVAMMAFVSAPKPATRARIATSRARPRQRHLRAAVK
jgi:hypothetical protein